MWIILVILTLLCYLRYQDNIFKILLLSSILTLISKFFVNSITLELILFLVYFACGIIFIKISNQKLFKQKKRYNLKNSIGMVVIVAEPFNNEQIGSVKFNGDIWRAKTESEQLLTKGMMVRIRRIEGLILYVD
ncbi:MAG: hypothetical protein ATN31_00575 [Candidatus Epulonipiscioides saccharophilum]|nr:MAG: hypothetical protein ATN31_00575 [Epulopiscium sp. AS2M-Bin001]